MEDCSKFHHCSAPICPIDSNWQKRKHLKGERVCFYLCETQKYDSEAIFRGKGLEKLYQRMVKAAPDISVQWGTIKKALTKAAKTDSRINKKPPSKKIFV